MFRSWNQSAPMNSPQLQQLQQFQSTNPSDSLRTFNNNMGLNSQSPQQPQPQQQQQLQSHLQLQTQLQPQPQPQPQSQNQPQQFNFDGSWPFPSSLYGPATSNQWMGDQGGVGGLQNLANQNQISSQRQGGGQFPMFMPDQQNFMAGMPSTFRPSTQQFMMGGQQVPGNLNQDLGNRSMMMPQWRMPNLGMDHAGVWPEKLPSERWGAHRSPDQIDYRTGVSVKKRHRLSRDQVKSIENLFAKNPHPSRQEKLTLAKELQLSYDQVKVWFQNRRARRKVSSKGNAKSTGSCGSEDSEKLLKKNIKPIVSDELPKIVKEEDAKTREVVVIKSDSVEKPSSPVGAPVEAPVEAASVTPSRGDAAPVDAAPVDAAPVDAAPVEAAPV